MRILMMTLCGAGMLAAAPPARGLEALEERSLAGQTARLHTDEQLRLYQALAEYQPENLHYRSLLAGGYLRKMRETQDPAWLERASKLVADVLAAEASNYEALRLRGEIELERHQFAAVAAHSRELIAAAPEDAWSWGALGDALMELGEYDKAADAYQRMLTLRPGMAAYNRAAYYRFIGGDAEGAIALMEQAAAAGTGAAENTAWCLVDLGGMYFKTGRLAEAAQSYAAALRAFSGYHPAHAGLGRVLAAQGRLREAIVEYRRAQSAVPLPEYAAALVTLYTAADMPEEARRQAALLDAADRLERGPNRGLALALADLDRKPARALELARAELAVRKDVYTWDALAWTLYRNGRYQEAAGAIANALRMNTPEPAFHYHAGLIERELGNRAAARRHLERALALNPRFDPVHGPLAEAALRELAAGSTALGRTLDDRLTAAQRNDACYELRGERSGAAIAAMRRLLADPRLRACAARNLREAGAATELQQALAEDDPELRALAVREIAALGRPELAAVLAAAALDENPLVAAAALDALPLPRLLDIAVDGGMLGTLALERASRSGDPAVLPAARRILAGGDPAAQVIALRIIAELGDGSDLRQLQELARHAEPVAARARGFGLMPPLDLARCARDAAAAIERRQPQARGAGRQL